MLKKIILILISVVIFSCTTTTNEPVKLKIEAEKNESIIVEPVEPENLDKVRSALSDNILANADPYYADFAFLVLDLIKRKQWDEITNFSDKFYYNSYIVEGKGSNIDFSTFMLHTGDEGLSPHYPISNLINAYYTDSYYNSNNNIVFQGIYLYERDETEFFKIIIAETDEGLTISRE